MRTYEESCQLLDRIVGRCIREEAFGTFVLSDPDQALAEYQLNEEELDDFRVLKEKHRQDAADTWRELREAIDTLRIG